MICYKANSNILNEKQIWKSRTNIGTAIFFLYHNDIAKHRHFKHVYIMPYMNFLKKFHIGKCRISLMWFNGNVTELIV